jgi:dolichol-phosphate mannosyltransferase
MAVLPAVGPDERTMATIQQSECTLVIPAYNEENRIGALLEDISKFTGEIICVCDGTDATGRVITSYAAAHPEIKITCLAYERRLGKGGAVLAGLRAAHTPFVGFMDADGSTKLGQMEALFQKLGSVDGVIGSRWVTGALLTKRQGFLRQAESRAFNLMVRILFQLPYHDTQCGAKVFRRACLEEVLPLVSSTGFAFDVELLWRMRGLGYRVDECPIVWHNVGDSKVRGPDALAMLTTLFRIRLRRSGRPPA